MSISAEAVVIGYLSQKLNAPVYADVPAVRPDRFVTVELVGGSSEYQVIDHPDIAIQCWSTSRTDADALSREVDEVMEGITEITEVTHYQRNSRHNFPDEEGKKPRYQIFANLTITSL